MKKYLLAIFTACLFLGGFTACDTDPENIDLQDFEKPEEYWENIRAFKATMKDRAVSFGWYGGWTVGGPSRYGFLQSLPDSMDIVAIWCAFDNENEEMMADLRKVQQQKGTKVVWTMILNNLGREVPLPEEVRDGGMDAVKEYYGWVDGDDASIEKAIRAYARDVVARTDAAGMDGFDIDWESFTGNITSSYDRSYWFIEELSKYMGPKSGTGKLLIVDGYINGNGAGGLIPKIADWFDYLVIQAYYATEDAVLNGRNNRFEDCYEACSGVLSLEEFTKRVIMTEDFEASGYPVNGGRSYTTRYGESTTSALGMAAWHPFYKGDSVQTAYKGGAGLYHFEYDYKNSPNYKWLRQMIQIMNPAKE
ncbi:MAG: glycoside hydrolase family 18 [Rikenellaceae bacterium]|nr:glycoside hydrolase family 18 [Rikenellaceae bacterium]